jgi:hypothetical protein
MRHCLPIAALVLSAAPLAAQAPTADALAKAAETITKEDIARRVGIVADDSMRGRDTPSPELEKTAQYVADQFKKFGLKPGGDNGTWFQRYPLPNDPSVKVPNTIGILEGSDPKLKNEYIVVSAHMDHIGMSPGEPDSVNNGADDDGSGTTGVMELAEAFSQPGARPRRSMIFLTVSGEEKGLWGSGYFTENPPVPLKQIVADLNSDMIGRGFTDTTVMVIGREHSDLGTTFDKVLASHPELRLTPILDPPARKLYSSDHYNFARRGVPILKFGGEEHEDYHQPSDSPDKIRTEREMRVLRMIFYVGQAVANADEKPKWNPDSYQQIVTEP